MSSETAPYPSCVDAEKLAAWSDGGLSAAEAAEVELHLSNCARCQAILSAFARAEPAAAAVLPFRRRVSRLWLVPLAAAAAAVVVWVAVPMPSPAPEQMAARSDLPVPAPEMRARGLETHLGPPAPATSPSMLAESQRDAPRSEPTVTPPVLVPKRVLPQVAPKTADERLAVAPPVLASPPPPPPPPPPPQAPASLPVPRLTSALTGRVTDPAGGAIPGATVQVLQSGAPVVNVVTDSSGRYRAAGLVPGPYDVRVALPGFQTLTRSGVDASTGVDTVVDATLQVGPMSESLMARSEPPGLQTSTGERAVGGAAGQAAAPPAAGRGFTTVVPPLGPAVIEIVAQTSVIPAGPTPAVAGGRGGGGGGGGRGGALSQTVASPSAPTTRWRIPRSGATAYATLDAVAKTGTVAPADTSAGRSTDGGASWQPISIDRSLAVTGGVAPSNTVCWLIGPKGVILLSTDGVRFIRVPFPEAVDLASIRATSAREASVTTADRRTFSTIDGGTTWVQGFE